ncbi:uncharacterized protein B0I36DRAFT_138776 [Microdochium trichocladiopsis]|uniref:Uncharacterized protein n=1 Tax=Microdochium trichocladiopsis TaxID=1682393 RepID=A0A9P8Y2V4_9PEZI|nr:uncharacterized protein B0I36DRAFT_138776 [Microdochium trichocladiopsis]KAH7027464.1 hypothetical protein B0I36DRAFT_138776 [Microdochium trichocladiopsis]
MADSLARVRVELPELYQIPIQSATFRLFEFFTTTLFRRLSHKKNFSRHEYEFIAKEVAVPAVVVQKSQSLLPGVWVVTSARWPVHFVPLVQSLEFKGLQSWRYFIAFRQHTFTAVYQDNRSKSNVTNGKKFPSIMPFLLTMIDDWCGNMS